MHLLYVCYKEKRVAEKLIKSQTKQKSQYTEHGFEDVKINATSSIEG